MNFVLFSVITNFGLDQATSSSTIMNLKEKCKKANSQKVYGSGNINNSDVKKTNNQNKKSSSKPSWLLKSQLWCYEKVLLVQLLTMLAMEPIIARLWRKLASIYYNVRLFGFFFFCNCGIFLHIIIIYVVTY